MGAKPYLTAEEAAAALGISRATLYAYVSRGLVRSEPAGQDSRRRRYVAADVAALSQRKEQQRNPAIAVERALDWGTPVLESAITLIDNGRFFYRGRDVLDLAQTASLEAVAGLLWTGALDDGPFTRAAGQLPAGWGGARELGPIERLQSILPRAAAADAAAYDLRPEGVVACGARIMRLEARVLSGVWPSTAGIAGALQTGWRLEPGARSMLNAALVLCADHELNVSAFTARCIASAGSTPYAVVLGGLAALQGTRHGGQSERVQALLDEVKKPAEARGVVTARLRRGESLPGFGHPLYPDGDPRAALLLQVAEEANARSPALERAQAVRDVVGELLDLRPSLDFGLVTLAQALGLPQGGSVALFALGRSAGWIGHAMEQQKLASLIRPRARYVGVWPEQ